LALNEANFEPAHSFESGDCTDSVVALQDAGAWTSMPRTAARSWTAVVLYRFSPERGEAEDQVSPVVHPARVVKAPEDWRSPRPGGLSTGPEHSRSVLDCGDERSEVTALGGNPWSNSLSKNSCSCSS
jgi:hypothetical protein